MCLQFDEPSSDWPFNSSKVVAMQYERSDSHRLSFSSTRGLSAGGHCHAYCRLATLKRHPLANQSHRFPPRSTECLDRHQVC